MKVPVDLKQVLVDKLSQTMFIYLFYLFIYLFNLPKNRKGAPTEPKLQ